MDFKIILLLLMMWSIATVCLLKQQTVNCCNRPIRIECLNGWMDGQIDKQTDKLIYID